MGSPGRLLISPYEVFASAYARKQRPTLPHVPYCGNVYIKESIGF